MSVRLRIQSREKFITVCVSVSMMSWVQTVFQDHRWRGYITHPHYQNFYVGMTKAIRREGHHLKWRGTELTRNLNHWTKTCCLITSSLPYSEDSNPIFFWHRRQNPPERVWERKNLERDFLWSTVRTPMRSSNTSSGTPLLDPSQVLVDSLGLSPRRGVSS